MSDWKNDKRWSDKFLPDIKPILGSVLIGEPPIEEDQERNTDLMVLKMDAVRIGCRVRGHEYLRYKDEFTVRAGRPSGMKTELTKIIEGWGDYFFYAIADAEDIGLECWVLGDLKEFRVWYCKQLAGSNPWRYPGKRKDNHDGSSFFFAYNWKEIPGFVVAQG